MARIHAYILADNNAAADRLVLGLYNHFKRIAALGGPGEPRDKISPGLRLAAHGRYNIYFRVTASHTVISRALHSARDVRRFNFGRDGA